jgi:hypothetical protein
MLASSLSFLSSIFETLSLSFYFFKVCMVFFSLQTPVRSRRTQKHFPINSRTMSERGLTKNQVKMVSWTSIAALLGAVWFATSNSSPTNARCRCFPGDTCWPSSAKWDLFNKTVGGRLIATVPIASPCHDTFPGVSFDAEKCAEIQANWPRPELHDETTHSPMAAFFANMSCDPFTPRDAQCVIGTYVPYAVNASGVADYRAALAFATGNNIRLVIRNTGHDYMGKSTGAGALACELYLSSYPSQPPIEYIMFCTTFMCQSSLVYFRSYSG